MSTALSSSARKVLRVLTGAEKPLSAYAILSKLQKQGLHSPPTIYRALDQLGRRGLVHKLESLNAFMACRKSKACGHEGPHVSAFAICTACSAVREFDDPALMKAIRNPGSAFLARVDKKAVELSGICHACYARGKKKEPCSL